ncbi:MAG: metallophosphoesterase [Clostridia bacterium]|nr:metallophosphoesterase [Clostridia bacterium]
MGLNIIQQFFFKLFTVILSLVYSIGGGVIAPPADDVIKAKNPDEVKMVFATLADPQVSNYMFGRFRSFQEACIDLKNAEVEFDALVGIGDIAENGLAEEYQLFYDELSSIDTRFIMATGNHDIRLRLYQQSFERFTKFTDALNGEGYSMAARSYAEGKFAYKEIVNGYKFLVMGSDTTEFEEANISDAQLEWLDAELAASNGEPVFVILHQPLKLTHNLPHNWGSGTSKTAGSVGKQSDAIKEVLAKHGENGTVVLITGHLHAGFTQYSYQKIESFHSFNVPSFSVDNQDGDINGAGLTYIVEVYENEILFRARDLINGKWLTDFDITIPVA